MVKKESLSLIAGIIAGLAAFHVYPQTGIYSSLLVGLGVAWLLYGLTSPSRMLSMMRFTMNPPMTALIAFFGAFIYLSIEGYQFWPTFLGSSAIALVGGIAGFLFYNFWNIGA